MKTIHRKPQIEEGISNIILQNRCGNRLTLLFHEGSTELEFVYKPNAFRRTEFRARNFSSRDNSTELFGAFSFPEIGVGAVTEFGYDPFITHIETEVHRAKNTITALNFPNENAFAIAARCPLTIAIRPRAAFTITDGLLTEKFTDRGEEIVSFVRFTSFEQNRFRVLDDGTVILQLMENDIVIAGGEENLYHVNRALAALGGRDLHALSAQIEHELAAPLSVSHIVCADPEMQHVLDFNKRIVYSGMDAGGACFGALNRIYHLIWVRDGAMTTSLMARAGLPALLKVWTPFVLANPSHIQTDDGCTVPAYLQILGSRWTKGEQDGIYYAVLSLFTLYETTGDQTLLHPGALNPLLDALDFNIETCFDHDLDLFMADTRGETTLPSSPYFGYDMVNGTIDPKAEQALYRGREIWRTGTLYHNVNLYNVLRMMELLLAEAGRSARATGFKSIADSLQQSIRERFVDPEGHFYSSLIFFEDGSQVWDTFREGDYWEHAWAVSVGPFFPDQPTALRTARMIREEWAGIRTYGYCPWNTLSRTLKEFGYSTREYQEMLADEIREAMTQTVKYPMKGALTEYWTDLEGWRALPFSAGSFLFTAAALLLQSLPRGLAVRASDLVDRIDNFHFRTYRIEAAATGGGDIVAAWTLNGQSVSRTLQIPEQSLRTGVNTVRVTRGDRFEGFRLHASTARLFSVENGDGVIVYHFTSAIACEMFFENFASAERIEVRDGEGLMMDFEAESIEDSRLTRVVVPSSGDFTVNVWDGSEE